MSSWIAHPRRPHSTTKAVRSASRSGTCHLVDRSEAVGLVWVLDNLYATHNRRRTGKLQDRFPHGPFRHSRVVLVASNAGHRAMLANEPLGFGRIDLGEQHGMHRRDLGGGRHLGRRRPSCPAASVYGCVQRTALRLVTLLCCGCGVRRRLGVEDLFGLPAAGSGAWTARLLGCNGRGTGGFGGAEQFLSISQSLKVGMCISMRFMRARSCRVFAIK